MPERHPHRRSRPTEPQDTGTPAAGTEFLFFSALFSGAAMLLYFLAAVSWNGVQERDEWIVYALLFSALPVAAVLLSRIGDRAFAEMFFVWNGAVLTALLAYLIIQPSLDALTGGGIRLPAMRPGVLLAVSVLHLAGVLVLGLPQTRQRFAGLADRIVIARLTGSLMLLAPLLLAAFFLVYSTWHAPFTQSDPGVIQRAIEETRFGVYLIVGVGLSVLALLLANREQRLLARNPVLHRGLGLAALGFVLIINLLLFDDGLWADMVHFRAVVEPALHFKHGGIPFVEVHSQYGLLPFLLTGWAFDVLPPNYSSAALVSRLANVAYLAVFVLLVYRLCGNKITATLLAIFGLLIHVTYYEVNLWVSPSPGGLRYLPPMLMLLALAYLPRERQHSVWTVAVLVLSSFWSLETFAYCVGPYAAFLIGTGMFRRRLLPALGNLLLPAAVIAAAHLLFTGFMLAHYGSLPRYDLYLGIFASSEVTGTTWDVPMSPYYWVWAINALVYFLVLSYFLYRVLMVRGGHIGAADRWLVSSLLPATAAGVLFASYFVGKSTQHAIYLAQLPLFVVVLAASDHLLWRSVEPLRSRRSLQFVLVLAVGIVAAIGLEKFFQPHSVHAGNSTILRQCFLASGCAPSRILPRLADRLASPPPGSELDIDRIYQLRLQHWTNPENLGVIRDGYHLLQTLAPEAERVAVFLDNDINNPITGLVLMYAGKWHKWPISTAYVDNFSPKLAEAIVASPVELVENEVVITLAQEDELIPLHRRVLDKIRAEWSLCPIARTASGVVAYRTSRDAACATEEG